MSVLPTCPQEWLSWYDLLDSAITDRESFGSTLQAVTVAAVDMIVGVSWASITRSAEQRCKTLAHAGRAALDVDAAQNQVGQGPSLGDPAARRDICVCADLAAEDRWPKLAARARRLGVRSVLSVPLNMDRPDTADSTPGMSTFRKPDAHTALNFYGARPHAFDSRTQQAAVLFAVHAGAVIATARRAEKIANLVVAVQSNREIGVAVGVLMTRHHLTRDDAFTMLRLASQANDRKLTDLASEVADTGVLRHRPRSAGSS